ncbi:MAG: translation elongation factor Ts [Clostridia bacterium]|jgi:elongation factor Ts|nr:translation elongation factor Ts [Clostridia bacterium]
MITTENIVKLRQSTGAGILDCKKALENSNGDIEKAAIYLREKGITTAAKKADRIASEGVVASYIHMGGKIGVLLEVNCETDFVANSTQFNELVKNIALQIAASKPECIAISDVNLANLENEKQIFKAQAINEGKPNAIIEKMVEGRVKKYYQDNCLLEQFYVKDPSKTITTVLNEAILAIGEKITIRRFTRYEMGEGLVKRSENFAEEIQKQITNK